MVYSVSLDTLVSWTSCLPITSRCISRLKSFEASLLLDLAAPETKEQVTDRFLILAKSSCADEVFPLAEKPEKPIFIRNFLVQSDQRLHAADFGHWRRGSLGTRELQNWGPL